ncbi:hypothetical protein [Planctobacterium marinum]|uniref:hypothetical protein n=1 Tax=Planctobacterium marinum TaxID=1631968 RepID=UPI001E2BF46C|nr:hypothetical protein [Planctobacterium marinum]MCC2607337.1 hypothetical protein [Planctobacterium marinum]
MQLFRKDFQFSIDNLVLIFILSFGVIFLICITAFELSDLPDPLAAIYGAIPIIISGLAVYISGKSYFLSRHQSTLNQKAELLALLEKITFDETRGKYYDQHGFPWWTETIDVLCGYFVEIRKLGYFLNPENKLLIKSLCQQAELYLYFIETRKDDMALQIDTGYCENFEELEKVELRNEAIDKWINLRGKLNSIYKILVVEDISKI